HAGKRRWIDPVALLETDDVHARLAEAPGERRTGRSSPDDEDICGGFGHRTALRAAYYFRGRAGNTNGHRSRKAASLREGTFTSASSRAREQHPGAASRTGTEPAPDWRP